MSDEQNKAPMTRALLEYGFPRTVVSLLGVIDMDDLRPAEAEVGIVRAAA